MRIKPIIVKANVSSLMPIFDMTRKEIEDILNKGFGYLVKEIKDQLVSAITYGFTFPYPVFAFRSCSGEIKARKIENGTELEITGEVENGKCSLKIRKEKPEFVTLVFKDKEPLLYITVIREDGQYTVLASNNALYACSVVDAPIDLPILKAPVKELEHVMDKRGLGYLIDVVRLQALEILSYGIRKYL